MPRVTEQEYLARHDQLQHFWNNRIYGGFTALTSNEQITLHLYYATVSKKSPEELLEARKLLLKENPSISSVAGKCYAKWERAQLEAFRRMDELANAPPRLPQPKYSRKNRVIKVYPLMNPDIDLLAKRLARVLIDHVREEMKRPTDQRG